VAQFEPSAAVLAPHSYFSAAFGTHKGFWYFLPTLSFSHFFIPFFKPWPSLYPEQLHFLDLATDNSSLRLVGVDR